MRRSRAYCLLFLYAQCPPFTWCRPLNPPPPLSPGGLTGGEALDYILMEALGPPAGEGGEGGEKAGTGFVNQLGLTLSGLQRFMRSLSQ